MLWRKFWKSNAKTNFLQTSVLFIKIQLSWSQLKKNQNISTSYIPCILLILFAGLDCNSHPWHSKHILDLFFKLVA